MTVLLRQASQQRAGLKKALTLAAPGGETRDQPRAAAPGQPGPDPGDINHGAVARAHQ